MTPPSPEGRKSLNSDQPVTFGRAGGWPVEVECECGWFASGRGFDATDAKRVGRDLLDQHRKKAGHTGPTEVRRAR